MNETLRKIEMLALPRHSVSDDVIRTKFVKLGLRNMDGTGVIAGVTSKGSVLGKEKRLLEDGSLMIEAIPGRLIYCGYDIMEFVRNIQAEGRFGFEETIYLLLTGELPNETDLKKFNHILKKRAILTKQEKSIIMHVPTNNNQMYALHSALSHLGRCDKSADSTNISDVMGQCLNILAKCPGIIAWNYRSLSFPWGNDLQFIKPNLQLSIAENFLYMLTGKIPTKFEACIFDLALILHAEHGGGNNSTFTVRCVSSSGANTYMAICSGIASLSGQLHGNANEAVVRMMQLMVQEINTPINHQSLRTYFEQIIDGEVGDKSGKIYGMGHAVYTISDPRAVVLKEKALQLAELKGMTEEYERYVIVEEVATQLLTEKYGKQICANVDFYSGFIYRMMGIPIELFTPIFAMSRMAGWAAHRVEEMVQDKIIRPAYISSLSRENNYVELKHRV